MSTVDGVRAGVNGDIPGIGKAVADISVGGIALLGGPPAWVAAGSYLVIDVSFGVRNLSKPITDAAHKITSNC